MNKGYKNNFCIPNIANEMYTGPRYSAFVKNTSNWFVNKSPKNWSNAEN